MNDGDQNVKIKIEVLCAWWFYTGKFNYVFIKNVLKKVLNALKLLNYLQLFLYNLNKNLLNLSII